MIAIIMFIAMKFFFIGVLLAIWACIMMYGVRHLRYSIAAAGPLPGA